MDAPLWGDAGGHTGTAPTHLHHIFPCIPHKQNNDLHAICPNETVGAAPVCPPERPRSDVSIPKIYALCTGDERWMHPCRATRAGTQAPPLPNSIIFFHTIPHKQNNHLCIICPNEINHPHAIHPNETVGAVPACPPERLRSGVSIQKNTRIVRGDERWMRPCRATRAGTQAPPLPIPTKPRGVPLPHHIVHSIAPNHAVCPYRIAVILSIAQGWQVQRSLPWVTMQARRLPPWGLYFFHHIAFQCPPTHTSGAEMHRALPPPLLKIKKCVYRYDLGVTVASP